jgi:Hint-domain
MKMDNSSHLPQEGQLRQLGESPPLSLQRNSGDSFSNASTAVAGSTASSRGSIWSSLAPTLRPAQSNSSLAIKTTPTIDTGKDEKQRQSKEGSPSTGEKKRPSQLTNFFARLRQPKEKLPKSNLKAARKPRTWLVTDNEQQWIAYGGGGGGGGGDGGHCDCGCFAGFSSVAMANGAPKAMELLQKGDRVLCDKNGLEASVVCMLTIPIPTHQCRMVRFSNGLTITPTHPVFHPTMGWVNPQDVMVPEIVKCKRVFNVVLEGGHTILVGGVVCATLGHRREGYTQHEFWGDLSKVMHCLVKVDADGFNSGKVEVAGNVRSELTGRVCGLMSLDGREVLDEDIA